MKYFAALMVGGLLLAVAGCSLVTKPPNGEDFYAQGEAMFQRSDYNASIDNYQHLIDQFPFSPYAEDAELKIALSYYQMHNYAEAMSAFADFERMHPTNKSLALASYYLAMTYYEQVRRPDQDQSNTEKALEQFQTLERRFPESPFAQLAHDRVQVCREVLASNEKLIGEYYYKRAHFRAAESRLAELMQKYPDTPVAPEALYELGVTLEKEGKKYSAAQAFAAIKGHFPDSLYAAKASQELKKLKQPIDNEEDPLRLVLTESGFGSADTDSRPGVVVRQAAARDELVEPVPAAESAANYGPQGLQTRASSRPKPGQRAAVLADAAVTLRSVRLSASDPPLSVIFDVSGPVKFEKHLESGPDHAALTVRLLHTKPDSKLEPHLTFDRSIFKNCEVTEDSDATTVTVNTAAVSHFAIIPLENPPRLLVTFTPINRELGENAGL